MNEQNPAGTITTSAEYKAALALLIAVGCITALKRCWIGLILGKQTYLRYSADLARIMRKAVLIGKVASLGRDIETSGVNLVEFGFSVDQYEDDDEVGSKDQTSCGEESNENGTTKGGTFSLGGLDLSARKVKISELLGEWEEPEDMQKAVS